MDDSSPHEANIANDMLTPQRDCHLPDPKELTALCTELNNFTFVDKDDGELGGSETGPQTTAQDTERSMVDAKIAETLKEGVDELCAGLQSDQNGQLREAFKHYKNGLAHLLFCRKYAKKNEAFVANLTKRFEEFMLRAEQIRDKLKSSEAGQETVYEKETEKETVAVCQLPECILMDTPALTLQDVIGLQKLKDCLKENIILPMKFPQLFQGSRRSPHRGIMLYGAPGVGKTMFTKALAGELAEVTVLRTSIYDFTSKYMSDRDWQLKQMFSYANDHSPSILIFDDFEGMFQRDSEPHRRLKTEFMVQFAALKGLVVVVGLTLSPWEIDAAIRKRFSKRVYVPMPDHAARSDMFRCFLSPPHLTAKTCPELTAEDYNELAHKTHGFTGADIAVVTRDAMMNPVRELQAAKYFKKLSSEEDAGEAVGKFVPCCHDDKGAVEKNVLDLPENEVFIRHITKADILQALELSKPSVSEEDLARFEQFTEDFGSLS